MLKQRVITALAMAGLFLAGIFFLPVAALAAAFALVVAAGAWEWAPLSGFRGAARQALFALLVLAGCAGVWFLLPLGETPRRADVQPVLGLACLWWCFALLWVRAFPGSAVIWNSRPMRGLMGLFVLVPAWVAAVYLLTLPLGGALMVALVLLVAASDIGAYFTGKRFGRHRLAPAVSPAKTWEGFWGGVACSVAVAALLWMFLPVRLDHLGLAAVVAVALVTALTSVLGDLTVSMVKRESGVKDSSSLLPGHGGLLDRLDSLCGAAPTFTLGLLLAGY
ncbi:phosphatidate cytidylyltransferase [Pseudohaliea rubra]|uniref:Phosphatidate cytidylyltransferase n=1 Tax=Pseudohaliea rubra DSM 19751 TaxID=1265313 RepID=A0A095X0Q8_9GAMM|nr:phosphatidate cytidylyltransferase [Pseudohaliea rubra]KGE04484.1 Phosphatidate cytidylyltransferase [Pseudohaliea rubra DSM 19751]